MSTDLQITIALLVFFALLAGLAYHLHARKHDSLKPRMVPWIVISMGSIATVFVLGIHLVNLLGVETGRG